MATVALAVYILMWPVISIAVLVVLWVAVGAEIRDKRRDGKDIV